MFKYTVNPVYRLKCVNSWLHLLLPMALLELGSTSPFYFLTEPVKE